MAHDTWGFTLNVYTEHLGQEVSNFWRNAHLGVTNWCPSVVIMHLTGPGVTQAKVSTPGEASLSVSEHDRASSVSHMGRSSDRGFRAAGAGAVRWMNPHRSMLWGCATTMHRALWLQQ